MVVGYQHFRKPPYRLVFLWMFVFFLFFSPQASFHVGSKKDNLQEVPGAGKWKSIDRAVEKQHESELVVLFHCLVKLFNT